MILYIQLFLNIVLQGFTDAGIQFAKEVFSNLMGGMAYFYGQSRCVCLNQ